MIPFLCMSAFVESETAQSHRSREKNPQTQQASRYLDPQGRISHKCIRDLEDFFGYTVLREDPSLLWSNISTCSARNPVRSSLCVPAVDLFFLFFFFLFAISLYQIHRARLVPRSFRLTGHELYAIPVLQQTIFFSL